jgi:hypothetical protein
VIHQVSTQVSDANQILDGIGEVLTDTEQATSVSSNNEILGNELVTALSPLN